MYKSAFSRFLIVCFFSYSISIFTMDTKMDTKKEVQEKEFNGNFVLCHFDPKNFEIDKKKGAFFVEDLKFKAVPVLKDQPDKSSGVRDLYIAINNKSQEESIVIEGIKKDIEDKKNCEPKKEIYMIDFSGQTEQAEEKLVAEAGVGDYKLSQKISHLTVNTARDFEPPASLVSGSDSLALSEDIDSDIQEDEDHIESIESFIKEKSSNHNEKDGTGKDIDQLKIHSPVRPVLEESDKERDLQLSQLEEGFGDLEKLGVSIENGEQDCEIGIDGKKLHEDLMKVLIQRGIGQRFDSNELLEICKMFLEKRAYSKDLVKVVVKEEAVKKSLSKKKVFINDFSRNLGDSLQSAFNDSAKGLMDGLIEFLLQDNKEKKEKLELEAQKGREKEVLVQETKKDVENEKKKSKWVIIATVAAPFITPLISALISAGTSTLAQYGLNFIIPGNSTIVK